MLQSKKHQISKPTTIVFIPSKLNSSFALKQLNTFAQSMSLFSQIINDPKLVCIAVCTL